MTAYTPGSTTVVTERHFLGRLATFSELTEDVDAIDARLDALEAGGGAGATVSRYTVSGGTYSVGAANPQWTFAYPTGLTAESAKAAMKTAYVYGSETVPLLDALANTCVEFSDNRMFSSNRDVQIHFGSSITLTWLGSTAEVPEDDRDQVSIRLVTVG